MARTPEIGDLLSELRRAPLSNAASLVRALGLGSQASLSRLIAKAGQQVVPVGSARARRYAAARSIRDLGSELRLFRIDATGTLSRVAAIRSIAPEGFVIDHVSTLPRWMRGVGGNGVFEGLPVFLSDLRPQGFLGRTFARRNAGLRLPDNPETWTDDDCVVALARSGDDMVGDLILGEDSARRLYAQRARGATPIPLSERATAYPALAEEAIDGVTPGSSAGGEQPKFGAIVGDEATPTHVIVKFSPADDSAAAQRWRDLLICEHLALQVLRQHEFSAVESEILEGGARIFLQTTRFDRDGLHGRKSVVSLQAMNGEYVGTPPSAGHWSEAVERLAKDRWLMPATVAQVRDLQVFGQFIANTDMHFGNVSFIPQDDGTLVLAPAYDMLPMGYAPVANELPQRTFVPPVPEPGHEAAWFANGERAIEFWKTVASNARISEPFRSQAAANAEAIANTTARFAGR